MESHVATWYGANRATFLLANDWPRSSTSGARSCVPSCWTALISSWLEPSGFAEFTVMPYFFWNPSMIAP
jgi:hypothetical protein